MAALLSDIALGPFGTGAGVIIAAIVVCGPLCLLLIGLAQASLRSALAELRGYQHNGRQPGGLKPLAALARIFGATGMLALITDLIGTLVFNSDTLLAGRTPETPEAAAVFVTVPTISLALAGAAVGASLVALPTVLRFSRYDDAGRVLLGAMLPEERIRRMR